MTHPYVCDALAPRNHVDYLGQEVLEQGEQRRLQILQLAHVPQQRQLAHTHCARPGRILEICSTKDKIKEETRTMYVVKKADIEMYTDKKELESAILCDMRICYALLCDMIRSDSNESMAGKGEVRSVKMSDD